MWIFRGIPSEMCGRIHVEGASRFLCARRPSRRPVRQITMSRLQEKRKASTRTGNTRGTPPLTALLPSSLALSLNHNFSVPAVSFQLNIVAPKSMISTLSPVGSTAEMRELPCVMLTCGCGGRPGEETVKVGGIFLELDLEAMAAVVLLFLLMILRQMSYTKKLNKR